MDFISFGIGCAILVSLVLAVSLLEACIPCICECLGSVLCVRRHHRHERV